MCNYSSWEWFNSIIWNLWNLILQRWSYFCLCYVHTQLRTNLTTSHRNKSTQLYFFKLRRSFLCIKLKKKKKKTPQVLCSSLQDTTVWINPQTHKVLSHLPQWSSISPISMIQPKHLSADTIFFMQLLLLAGITCHIEQQYFLERRVCGDFQG